MSIEVMKQALADSQDGTFIDEGTKNQPVEIKFTLEERIDEIAFKAGCYRNKYCDPNNPDLDGYIINQAVLDKFASFIENEVRSAHTADVSIDSLEFCKFSTDVVTELFEFSDKGAAEVVVCKTGLTYGVQCVNFPNVFAQFVFESDAKQFVNIFNGTVAQRVESPVTGGGGGFESRPVPANTPAVDAEPVAWMYTLEYGDTVADKKVSLSQLNYPFGVCGADYLRENSDGMSYVRQTPLYAHPTPAASAESVASVHIKDGCLIGSQRKSGAALPDGQYALYPIGTYPTSAVMRQLVEALQRMTTTFLDTEGSHGSYETDAIDFAESVLTKAKEAGL